MSTKKQGPNARARTKSQLAGRAKGKLARPVEPTGYSSAAWERVSVLSAQLDVLARDLGLHDRDRDPDGFDLVDAAREFARLAGNHDRARTPEGRTRAQERDDWVAVGGLGADLGNMAGEAAHAGVARSVRAVAHEVCYLACNYLF
jgi:hypothetical protein